MPTYRPPRTSSFMHRLTARFVLPHLPMGDITAYDLNSFLLRSVSSIFIYLRISEEMFRTLEYLNILLWPISSDPSTLSLVINIIRQATGTLLSSRGIFSSISRTSRVLVSRYPYSSPSDENASANSGLSLSELIWFIRLIM